MQLPSRKEKQMQKQIIDGQEVQVEVEVEVEPTLKRLFLFSPTVRQTWILATLTSASCTPCITCISSSTIPCTHNLLHFLWHDNGDDFCIPPFAILIPFRIIHLSATYLHRTSFIRQFVTISKSEQQLSGTIFIRTCNNPGLYFYRNLSITLLDKCIYM